MLLAFFPIAVAALSMGCATPKPVLDLAGKGAATVGLAEISLRDYLQLANAQAAARMALVRYDAVEESDLRTRDAFDRFLSKEAGLAGPDTQTIEFIKKMAAERRRAREAGEAELAEIEKTLSADTLQRGKVPAERLAVAKDAFVVLAQELSAKEWLALAASYAREVRDDVKALRGSLEGKQPQDDTPPSEKPRNE
jgi:hypothetical protein